MANAEKWDTKTMRWAMPASYCLTFMWCQPCLPNFQCLHSCVSWPPFCIFFCYASSALTNATPKILGI